MPYRKGIHGTGVAHGVYARDFTLPDGADGELVLRGGGVRFQCPAGVPGVVFQKSFRQRDGRAGRGIQFVDVVYFLDLGAVLGVGGHQAGKGLVERKKQIDTQGKVGTIQQGASGFLDRLAHLRIAIGPSSGAAYGRDAGAGAVQQVVRCGGRGAEVHHDIGSRKVGRSGVGVDPGDDAVSALQGDLLDEPSHFSISRQGDVQGCFHGEGIG